MHLAGEGRKGTPSIKVGDLVRVWTDSSDQAKHSARSGNRKAGSSA